MNVKLRSYQQDFIDAVRNEFKGGYKHVVGVAPCGAGKTIMTGWIIREALAKNNRSIFFVHRKELIEQTAKTFYNLGIPFGIISADAPQMLSQPVQIASVQTLARRVIDRNGQLNRGFIDALNPRFLICDECHHILANTYKKVLDAFPDAFLLGVTATPQRMGGVTLADAFDSMVESLPVNELIKRGNLTPFQYFAPESNIDLSGVRTVHGDFDNHALEEVMGARAVVGNIVDNYRELAPGKSAICYCVNVHHSQTVAAAFNNAGIPAAHCDGETPALVRSEIVNDFRRGNVKVLCNAELFGEGFDVPGCQAVLLARPTQSLTLFIQQSMRALRPDPNDPGKVAVIIDHVENYRRHGMPNDERDWTLIPGSKRKIRCPQCKRLIAPAIKIENGERKKVCPECDYEFEIGAAPNLGTRQARTQEGELAEVNVNYDVRPDRANTTVKKKPTTVEEFLIIAKQKKRKPAWAAYQAVEFAKTYDEYCHIAKTVGYKPGWAWYQWKERHIENASSKTLQNVRFTC